MFSSAIYDFNFNIGDFANFISVESITRVRIIDVIFLKQEKYYVIMAPKQLLKEAGFSEKEFLNNYTVPKLWAAVYVDPDELEPANKLRFEIIKGDISD